MPASDTAFLILFVILFGALSITNFIQNQSNDKTQYQNYFGLIYLIAFIFLIFSGWSSLSG